MDSKISFFLKEAEQALDNKLTYPVTCEIDPTTICQNQCSFCINKESNTASHSILDYNLYADLLPQLKELGVKSITFTGGGEPLLHPKISEMIISAHDLGFELGLITNGIGLPKITNEIPLFQFIRISLYGSYLKTYIDITGKDHFEQVCLNIKSTVRVKENTTVGISFVLDENNYSEVTGAKYLASVLGVDYIQFKPLLTHSLPSDLVTNGRSIATQRYEVTTTDACKLANLIGIVSADGCVYFCCLKRGESKYNLGDLRNDSFKDIWSRRLTIQPDISKCKSCRYMNYVKGFRNIAPGDRHFIKHKNFL